MHPTKSLRALTIAMVFVAATVVLATFGSTKPTSQGHPPKALSLFLAANALSMGILNSGRREEETGSDPPPGVVSPSLLEQYLCREMWRAEQTQRPLALLHLSLDDLRSHTEQYGSSARNEALHRVSGLAREVLRDSDVICKTGGEELVVALPETGIDVAATVAEQIRERIASGGNGEDRRRETRTTIAIGVAVYRSGEGPVSFQLRAEQAARRGSLRRGNPVSLDPHDARASLLVVLREEALLALYCGSLCQQGYSVERACTGAAACRRVQDHSYDLLITGSHLPDMSGVELVQAIRLHVPQIPIILLAAKICSWNEAAVRSFQDVEYLLDPPRPQDVVDSVTWMLAREQGAA
ncbi:MAG: diguanylate cyclase [Armatimonadetes bacterium]|nr:diguanylate cyclase [Armatimonadota bacterium]